MNSVKNTIRHLSIPVIVLMLLVSSCVPNKKLVYLQSENELKKEKTYDSITATYNLKLERYTLKPEDIISLRVASVTPDEYNFIKKYEQDLGIIRKLNQYDRVDEGNGNASQPLMGGGGSSGGSETGFNNISNIILDRMNTGFVLDLNGELTLPQIGSVSLSGLTIPEAEARVSELLSGYFETPMVRIQLLNFHFTIMGEVTEEGRYTSFDPELSIFDAITMSGNLTEFADRSNIKLIRREGGQAKIIYINALDENTLNAESLFLKKGDLIIVPPLKARTTRGYILPNVSIVLGVSSTILSIFTLFFLSTR
ncbi:MAG: polysaccharide biosynthesis/export family protein [Cyclobacteriaceae bacterium]